MRKVYLLLSLFIFITSCEKDDLNQEQLPENEVGSASFLKKKIGRQEIESNPKISKELTKIASNTTKKSSERYIHIDNPNLIMIVDNAIHIKKGKYDSYTFPTLQGKDENIKNILFNKNEKGGYDAYLMEYNYSWNEFSNAEPSELSNELTRSPLNLNLDDMTQKQMESRWVCVYEYHMSYIYHYISSGVAYYEEAGWVLSGTPDCHIVNYEVVGSNYSPTYTSTYTTNGETATYTGTSTIFTSPINDPLLDEEFLHALNVVKSELGTRIHDREKRYLDSQLAVTMNNYWFLEKHGFSEEAKNFSAEAVNATFSRGEVDFENEIIYTSAVPECAKDIIKKLLNDNAYIDLRDMPDFVKQELNLSGYILNLFENSDNYNLIFDAKSNMTNPAGLSVNARTVPDVYDPNTPDKHTFRITLNLDYIANGTNLALARTIIHESIHAYIEYMYQDQIFSDLSMALSFLLSADNANDNSAQHQLMTEEFVQSIANSLENWDNNRLNDNNYYYYMSWSGGMLTTPAFNALDNATQGNIENANLAEGDAINSSNNNTAKSPNTCQ